MAFKFFVVALVATVANAGVIPVAPTAYAAPVAYGAPLAYAAPIAKAVVTKTIDADYDPHPQYTYSYDVQDSLTGDYKSQQESRDGDVVHGSYSLVESDGTRRIVDYTADPANGFNAVVRKEPAAKIAAAPIATYAAPAVAKLHAAPAPIAKLAAPIAYAAPAAHLARPLAPAALYGAPVASYPKIAAPVSYISHVSYATPLFSYSH